MKVCSQCNRTLAANCFTKRSRNKDGLDSSCKECKRAVNALLYKRYKDNPESKSFQKIDTAQSFLALFPKLAKNWDYSVNKVLPSMVSPKNSYIAAWDCSVCHYKWSASLNKITLQGNRVYCPKCEGNVSDVVTATHPHISDWVDDMKQVSAISKGSHKRINFICPDFKHSFSRKLNNFRFICPICAIREKSILTVAPHLVAEWSCENSLKPEQVSYSSAKIIHWVCDKQHEWSTPLYQRTSRKKTGCPVCALTKHVSTAEQELKQFIETLNLESLETHNRTFLNGQELDIYVPGKSFAVEFNGLYWHSEKFKNKAYHYDKWKACKDKGIQLIQVWEDDYVRNPGLVKRMLAHKLGVSAEEKVFARKTRVKDLTQEEVNLFLAQNHIQGAASGSVRIGLTFPGTQTTPDGSKPLERLVAVMVLKKEPGTNGETLNLLRFATSQPVVGGFTKLLTHVEKITGSTLKQIITFSDNTVSDGGLYEKNGFVADKHLAPDYTYLVKGVRVHKFNYRLKRFREDPQLEYKDGLSERELALLNNLPRVWDAGKTRWVKRL